MPAFEVPMSLLPLRRFAFWVVVGAVLLGGSSGKTPGFPTPLRAEPLRPADVPAPLQPWIPWVLLGRAPQLCPTLTGQAAPVCAWAGRLALVLDDRGGRFTQSWELQADGEVALPGDQEHWPLDVREGGKRLAVLAREDGPAVFLPRGSHQLSGTLSWSRLPEVLPIPEATGLLGLTLNGREVGFPRREEGRLFLAAARTQAGAEADKLEITVHRKVTDSVPLLLTTRFDLVVAGKSREVVLANPLPTGFVAHALTSALPVRLGPDGKLHVQVRAGSHQLTLIGRAPTATAAITRPVLGADDLGNRGDEIWAFEARPDLRVVTVSGVAPVDPRQTNLPGSWRSLPAYLVGTGATIKLDQRRRGDADPAPDRLTLHRQLWLDFDGRGYTVRDQLGGRMERSARLEMGPGQDLGRVVMDGADQPITQRVQGGPAGFEVRQVNLSAQTEARIEGDRLHPPVVGWAHDFQSVGATLALPPGWRLFHASGADQVEGTWVRGLSLLDLFLVLVVALAAGRLFGVKAGVLALVTMFLLVQEAKAPTWIWLAVLVGEALVRALPAGNLRKVAKGYRLAAGAVLLLAAFPFALDQIRGALHPGAGGGQQNQRMDFSLLDPGPPEPSAMAPAPAPPGEPAPQQPLRAPAAESAKTRRHTAKMLKKEEATIEAEPSPDKDEAEEDGVEKSMTFEGVAGGTVGSSPGSIGGLDATSGLSGKLGGGASGSGNYGIANLAAPRSAPAAKPRGSASLRDYDPNAEVQTGPGLPRWEWTSIGLGWNGPVAEGARLSLWLIPPWASALLGLARIVLMGVFIVILLRAAVTSLGRYLPPVTAGVLGLLMLGNPTAAAAAEGADFPPQAMLDELRTHLTERPACHPECASFGRLVVEAGPDQLRLRLEADASWPTAVALPGLAQHWSPASVSVDGRPATAVVRDDGGRLWLFLTAGAHQVLLEGPLDNRPTVQIPFGSLRPHAVASNLRGFTLVGLAEDGAVGDSLELVRAEKAAKPTGDNNDAETQNLPAFVTVERTLVLGLEWRVHTRIQRATPAGTAVVTEIPLLPGESVLSEGIKVAAGKVQVNMGPDQPEASWQSVLAQKSPIDLRAPALGQGSWAEVWRLDAGPLWNVHVTGIPATHPGSGDAERRVRMWRPWPSETVSIDVTRPGGKKGQTVTIDGSTLELTPGARSTDARLSLSIRASRGGEHALTLPDGATLTSLAIDGRDQPLRQDARKVTVPLTPGGQAITLGFQASPGLGPWFSSPDVDLGAASVNADVTIHLPVDRWVLWTRGPRLGPAVLLPSALLLVLLVAWLLGRARVLPLRTHQLVLLGLGFLPLSLGAAGVMIGLLIALSWRRMYLRTGRGWLYDLVQIALGLWSLIAIALVFAIVREGLLSSPQMEIAGNGSSPTLLHWTADRAAGALPTASVLSLPLFAYHLAMLAWALWLAIALIRWAPWVWSCLTAGGLWRPVFGSKVDVPPAPRLSSSATLPAQPPEPKSE
jgi:hypothetical protein